MHEFHFPYGSREVMFRLPGKRILGEILPRDVTRVEDFPTAFQNSLSQPIQSPPLQEICAAGEKVAIVVPDVTRPFPGSLVLPLLLDELNRAGIPDQDIRIVFALGGHRRHTPDEQRRILGEDVAGRVPYIDSFCEDRDCFTAVGTTSFGTRVEIHNSLVEADRKILTGSITHHYYSGFSGGRKAIVPGVSSHDTIQANHKLLLNPAQGSGHNPKACSGRLTGNPVHEDMVEACRMVKPDFLVNVVQSGQQEILQIFTGDPYAAHEEGCRFVDRVFGCPIHARADLVIASAGGFPRDISYYQAHKALDSAFHATKKGGVIILAAECREGVGPDGYMGWVDTDAEDELERLLRERFEVAGHNWYATLLKAHQVRIILVSSLDPSVVRRLHFLPAPTIDDALDTAWPLLPSDPAIYVMPQAYTTFPTMKDQDILNQENE